MLKDVTKAVKGNKKVMLVLGIIIIIVIIVVVYQIYKAVKKGADITGEAMTNATLAVQLNLNINRVIWVKGKALDLWDISTVRRWQTLWTTREYIVADFIKAINDCTLQNEVLLLASEYKQHSGVTLTSIIRDIFYQSQRNQLNHNWLVLLTT